MLRATRAARRGTEKPTDLRSKLRAWAGRVSGRADRRLLFAVVDATDALVTSCNQLADRLAAQEAVNADVTAAFGEEITQLRAEVIHLQRVVDSLHDSGNE